MTESNETTGKFLLNEERRSEGISGPSREVSKRNGDTPGAAGVGQENGELEWARKHVLEGTGKPVEKPAREPGRGVFRKTELHGTSPGYTPMELKKLRRRTMQSFRDPGSVVTYGQYEEAHKAFICSLMEHQDLLEENLLMHLADLQQQIDVLESRLEQVRSGLAEVREARG